MQEVQLQVVGVDEELGQVMPQESRGIRVTFKDLTYSVKNHKNRKESFKLLDNVSGFFHPGQMAALMGPSGSGKTTLLDLLAGRKTVGKTEGSILFAGAKPTKMFLRRYTGYVEQFDTLLDNLTVYEMLMYTAELKRPLTEPLEDKKRAVMEVIDQLALNTCRDTLIGNPLARGVSGGQAKRANIGISLITQPKVLFLDEPTSGLDSYTANEVMTYVKALAKSGISICATIHSPTAYTFALFDSLTILLRGNLVYFGTNGTEALNYFRRFSTLNLTTVESVTNHAEWLVDVTTKADHNNRHMDLAEMYNNSSLKSSTDLMVTTFLTEKSSIPKETMEQLNVTHETVTPFWWAIWVLFKYRTTSNLKNPMWLGPRIGDKVLFTFVMTTLFWGFGDRLSSADIINPAQLLFMWVILPAFGASGYVPTLVLERPLFYRERNDGLYRVITYLSSKMLEELSLAAVVTSLCALVAWFPLQLRGSWTIFWLGFYVTLCCGIVAAYLIAAIAPNMDFANAALPAYIVTLLFFAGFIMRWSDIPPWWIWYGYIDFLRYAWGALMKNQFDGIDTEYLGGLTILEFYSLDGINPWVWLAIEFGFFVVFFFLAWLALSYVRHQKR